MFAVSPISNADIQVWVGTLGIYGALYFLFVYMFGSADGTVSLKKKDRAGKAAAAPAAKATRSRSSSRKR